MTTVRDTICAFASARKRGTYLMTPPSSGFPTIRPTFLRAEGFVEPNPPGMYTERLG